ncbi:MAG: 16S rRNA (guanine(527)-N(7))-methyltransferase RsmG [Methylococcaceae bacterium]|nr:16S rRNA (guanine(527)-N(7))-methyltransferase RsmG [Methylococcaceae bacterium]
MIQAESLLRQGLAELPLAASENQVQQLLSFLRLLLKWNRVYNLTAIDRAEDMVGLHLLDSLAVLPHLGGERILDVGTGAGLPGIPLALFEPTRQFVLLDSNAKKTRFVTQAVIELGLRNVRVEHARIEQYAPDEGFDRVICRAYAALPEILDQTRRLLRRGGKILALKGRLAESELAPIAGVEMQTFKLDVPGIDAERHVVAITVRD